MIFNSIPTDYFLGVLPHIVAGSVLAGLTIIHILLSRKYFIACLRMFFSKKLKIKARINIVIDILLIGLLIAVTITGIQISPNSLNGSVDENLELTHGMLAAMIVILSIIHGCLHIKIKKRKVIKYEDAKVN